MRYVLLIASLASIALLQACNTVEGAGKDLRKAGEAVEKAADKASK